MIFLDISIQKKMKNQVSIAFFIFFTFQLCAQDFYRGADLSYTNEMEECGTVYKENNEPKDIYQIFSDHSCNLVRLRLWHTPTWQDGLNSGNRFSDLADVKISIARAKAAGMQVLLDFHLSDTWADPAHQYIPAVWLPVVDNLPVLKDSLSSYITETLKELEEENLVPEMVQIGNETNRGILLSPEVNDAAWTMDWERNGELFKTATQAVRDFSTENNHDIKIALHIADPIHVEWYFDNFLEQGVTEFDIVAFSYYQEWHGDTTLEQLGDYVAQFKQDYNREVMVVETGYPWTPIGEDDANNILNASSPDFGGLSPFNQQLWLIDLANEIKDNGGNGLVYWEPGWVSTSCSTPWATGSHYENATFFGFNDNLKGNGGINWMNEFATSIAPQPDILPLKMSLKAGHKTLHIKLPESDLADSLSVFIYAADGNLVTNAVISHGISNFDINLPVLPHGIYSVALFAKGNKTIGKGKVAIFQ